MTECGTVVIATVSFDVTSLSLLLALFWFCRNDVRRMAPTILHGRNPHELPPKALGEPMSGPSSVFAAMTGPEGGLTTVNRRERHITTNDPDVDFIDIHDQTENEQVTGNHHSC